MLLVEGGGAALLGFGGGQDDVEGGLALAPARQLAERLGVATVDPFHQLHLIRPQRNTIEQASSSIHPLVATE